MRQALDPDVLAEIQRAYVETDEAVTAIAARLAVSVGVIQKYARLRSWPRRRQGVARPGTKAAALARATVEERLYRVMIRKLEQLERRMDKDEPEDPADREREMREINAVVCGFEKVKEIGTDDKPRPARPGHAALEPGEAERIRQEIAERLERLHQRWSTRRDAE